MNDLHALSGAYAVDALDDLERARFERHLEECAECRAEVDELRATATLLPETTATAPPSALRERVMTEIATVRPLPPETPETPEPAEPAALARQRPPRRILAGLVAAAVALIVLGGAVATAWHPWTGTESSPGQDRLSAEDAVLRAADAERVSASLGDGAQATIVRSKSLNHAVVVTRNMPDAPAGFDYVLWFNQDGEMVVDRAMPDGPAHQVLMKGDAARADGVGITVEREGSLPSVPSDDQVALIGFEKA